MTAAPERITLRQPDDWHLHVRDGATLAAVLPFTARQMGRAIIMPNLVPPVVNEADARAYRDRILAALPAGSRFQPLMTLYLTDRTQPDEVDRALASGTIAAVKLYPAGATTNAHAGVTDLARLGPVLEVLAARGAPLLVHGEVTDPAIDIFEREAVFLMRVAAPLLERHPKLRMVVEHVTSAAGVAFVRASDGRVGATITAHHLHIDRNDLLVGGVKPHFYCLPVVKSGRDRAALIEAATSGHPAFFLGTDSAPHSEAAKECACGAAGIFTAPTALELYAEIFDRAGRLDRLEAFASLNGPAFYRLPPNEARVTLERRAQPVPARIAVAADPGPPVLAIHPFRGGQDTAWTLLPAA